MRARIKEIIHEEIAVPETESELTETETVDSASVQATQERWATTSPMPDRGVTSDTTLLLPGHQALLGTSAISGDVAAARGYCSVGKEEAPEVGFTGNQARPQ